MDFEPYYQADKNVWGERPTNAIAEHANLLRPGSLLDLGAGDGRNAIYLARAGFDVTAVDVAATGLANLREKAEGAGVGVRTVEADVRDLEPGQTYDNIITSFTVHFLDDEADIEQFLEKIVAATNPGGTNIVEDFTPNGPLAAGQEHNYVTPEMLQSFYSSHGWEVLVNETHTAHSRPTESRPSVAHEAVTLIARRPSADK